MDVYTARNDPRGRLVGVPYAPRPELTDEERRRAASKHQASLRRHALEVELCVASVRAAARGRKMTATPVL